MKKFYAHSLPGKPQSEWQELSVHLNNVAEMAVGFADEFINEELGSLGKGNKIRLLPFGEMPCRINEEDQ